MILGGGGFRVPLICRELAASGLAVGEVVLYDVAPERLGVIAAVLAGGGLPLRVTTDLDEALRGTDVICAAAGVDPGPRLAQVPDGVEVDYLGLNHLGWLRGLRVNGTDRLPGLLADPDTLERTEEGKLFGTDFLQALGAIPNEYLYWYYA